jgi:ABC-type sugar transport system substrate-binding protein
MAKELGVPLEEFTQAIIESYKKGFNDAIEVLKTSQTMINTEEMKKTITDILHKQGKIKTDW